MNFNAIDFQTWPQSRMFRYFSQMAPTGYSITADMDVSGLHGALKAKGCKFFRPICGLSLLIVFRPSCLR